MVMAETDQPPLNSDECRAPTLEDVVRLCRALNEAGAKQVRVIFRQASEGETRGSADAAVGHDVPVRSRYDAVKANDQALAIK